MMLRDHENGLLVPKGNAQVLYLAMKEIIENPALATKLSLEAAKLREELNISAIADRWEAMIG